MMPSSGLASEHNGVLAGGHPPLPSYDDVLAGIRVRAMAPLPVEEVALPGAASRVLAETIRADRPVPGYRNSAVDGYAFRAADGAVTGPLQIAGRSAAGHPYADDAPPPGSAIRILTGAVVPAWADTVIVQEDCEVTGGLVVMRRAVPPGANIREPGEEVREGAVVLGAGQRLRPQDLAMAATAGRASLLVYRRLRVAVLATGDELRLPGSPLPPGCLHESNGVLATSVLRGLGFEATDCGIARDDFGEIAGRLADAARSHDLIITSGGASAGDSDHVIAAVESLGSVLCRGLAVKPGKGVPLGEVGGVPFVGLPGNPVAAMIALVMVARPLALRLAGATSAGPRRFPVPAGQDLPLSRDRRHFLRGRLEQAGCGQLTVRKFRSDSSGMLTSLTWSDGLIDLPPGTGTVPAGTPVDFIPYTELLS